MGVVLGGVGDGVDNLSGVAVLGVACRISVVPCSLSPEAVWVEVAPLLLTSILVVVLSCERKNEWIGSPALLRGVVSMLV